MKAKGSCIVAPEAQNAGIGAMVPGKQSATDLDSSRNIHVVGKKALSPGFHVGQCTCRTLPIVIILGACALAQVHVKLSRPQVAQQRGLSISSD